MMLHFRNIVYNYIFTRDFFLLSISPGGSVFQLLLPLIIRLRQILSLKIKHRLLLAAMVESRVVMVFLVSGVEERKVTVESKQGHITCVRN